MLIRTKKDYFAFEYDFKRPGWFCYYYQLLEIWRLLKIINKKNAKILEVGIGNGTVADYLKKRQIDIKTFDINKELNPDVIGDVKNINLPKNSVDIILCAEVLEHLSFNHFEEIIDKLNKITRKFLILTLPETYNKKRKYPNDHFWEIGYKKYKFSKIKNILDKYFEIKKDYSLPLYRYQRMLVLEKHG